MAKVKFNEAALRTPEGVAKLMASSQTEKEWNENCDAVIAANGRDYPSFWFDTIEMSGLARNTVAKFKP